MKGRRGREREEREEGSMVIEVIEFGRCRSIFRSGASCGQPCPSSKCLPGILRE